MTPGKRSNNREIPAMNEELRKWMQESKEQIEFPQKSEGKNVGKKPLGRCHVCGHKEGKALCIKCGKPTCTRHYYHLVSLCKKCLSKTTAEQWKQHHQDWEKTLGVKWID